MSQPSYYTHPEYSSLTTALRTAEEHEGYYLLEFEDTIFYPEGGGQPADRGTIGEETVLGVIKREGRILHKVQNLPSEEKLHLTLDRSFRDHFSRQHTGQHLISALLAELSGVSTLSVHLGTEETTIETDAENLNEHDLIRVEQRANQEISLARPVTAIVVKDRQELEKYSIPRDTEKKMNIRLVEIKGLDRTPCGGLHVFNTAEIGLIKYTGMEKVRGHIRLKWKINSPAYNDYRMRFDQISRASTLLSVKPDQTVQRLEEILMEKKISDGQSKISREKEAERISRKLSGSVCCFPPLVTAELKDCSRELFRDVVKNLSTVEGVSFLLCSVIDGKINWALHLPLHKNFAYADFSSKCLSLIGGKGGGKVPLWQGSGDNAEMLRPFISSFRSFCRLD